ncbi:MAG: hypothetical protein ACK4WD_09610 [Flavobacteriales bacterium]|jgi:hypothetical protein
MDLYRKKIDDYIKSFDDDTLGLLRGISVEKNYKKGDLLLGQNDVCRRSFLIMSGAARKYSSKESTYSPDDSSYHHRVVSRYIV